MTSKSEPADLLISMPSPANVSSSVVTDLANLSQAQGGDREAFVALYTAHVRAVYWFALKMVRSITDAEDITQDTFVIAWSKRHAIRPVDQSVLPWLLVTARNLGNNRIRSRARDDHHRTDSDLSNFPDPQHRSVHDEVQNRMLLDAIDHAVGQLTETDQTLYYLCIDEGLSYEQAARALGTSHGAVRNRLARVRITLRNKLSAQKEALS
ncbi:RNA polymerase sigma factor [Cryobacterium sp. N19]|uniref:RNA polymerase sigma factor n=1 Tax=Cryobacterium sp. N19 TaxID=2048288 RepID=UPI0018EE2464|nr:RNA polymerase sigma factor [Cryobacterium sp. N19]